MKITNWLTEDECKAAIGQYLEKYDNKTLEATDAHLFFKSLFGGIYSSKVEEEDEDKQELWENMSDDIEEFESLGYFIEVRDINQNYVFILNETEQKIGTYEGEYNEEEARVLIGTKYVTWMDWTPACQLKIMKGNPNTDPEFFSGDCTVKGSLKLGAKPRQWIYDLFVFIDREVE